MSDVGFYERRKLGGGIHGRVGCLDFSDPAPGMFDRASPVGFAEIEVQGPGGDQRRHCRGVTKSLPSGNKVGETIIIPIRCPA